MQTQEEYLAPYRHSYELYSEQWEALYSSYVPEAMVARAEKTRDYTEVDAALAQLHADPKYESLSRARDKAGRELFRATNRSLELVRVAMQPRAKRGQAPRLSR